MRDPNADCRCGHSRTTHAGYTGACGLCDDCAYVLPPTKVVTIDGWTWEVDLGFDDREGSLDMAMLMQLTGHAQTMYGSMTGTHAERQATIRALIGRTLRGGQGA